ncbi:MAG: response regulator transcription factor [Chloroflexi bacterium]|nr:response regulator transcription factor [Chloroflexota bacterium]
MVDGDRAVPLVAERKPDLLVLDVVLPGMSGVEVARVVRAGFPRVRILVFTGYSDDSAMRALLRLGVHGYLYHVRLIRAKLAATSRVDLVNQARRHSFLYDRPLQRSAYTTSTVKGMP